MKDTIYTSISKSMLRTPKTNYDYLVDADSEKEIFERLWRDNFSLIPPMDTMDKSLREKLKDFTYKVFINRIDPSDITFAVDRAYDDGFVDGKYKASSIIKEKFPTMVTEIENAIE